MSISYLQAFKLPSPGNKAHSPTAERPLRTTDGSSCILDPSAFPVILDLIIAHSDHRTRVALWGTSHALYQHMCSHLFRKVVHYCGGWGPAGYGPDEHNERFPVLYPSPSPTGGPEVEDNIARYCTRIEILSNCALTPFNAMAKQKCKAKPAEVTFNLTCSTHTKEGKEEGKEVTLRAWHTMDLTRFHTIPSTIVIKAFCVNMTNSQWFGAYNFMQHGLPEGPRRVVFNLTYSWADQLFCSAITLNALPKSVEEVVFHFKRVDFTERPRYFIARKAQIGYNFFLPGFNIFGMPPPGFDEDSEDEWTDISDDATISGEEEDEEDGEGDGGYEDGDEDEALEGDEHADAVGEENNAATAASSSSVHRGEVDSDVEVSVDKSAHTGEVDSNHSGEVESSSNESMTGDEDGGDDEGDWTDDSDGLPPMPMPILDDLVQVQRVHTDSSASSSASDGPVLKAQDYLDFPPHHPRCKLLAPVGASAPIPTLKDGEHIHLVDKPRVDHPSFSMFGRIAALFAKSVESNPGLKLTLVGVDEFDAARDEDVAGDAIFVEKVGELDWGEVGEPSRQEWEHGEYESVEKTFVRDVKRILNNEPEEDEVEGSEEGGQGNKEVTESRENEEKWDKFTDNIKIMSRSDYRDSLGYRQRQDEDWWPMEREFMQRNICVDVNR